MGVECGRCGGSIYFVTCPHHWAIASECQECGAMDSIPNRCEKCAAALSGGNG